MFGCPPEATDQPENARGPSKRPNPFEDGAAAGAKKRVYSPLTQPCSSDSSLAPIPPILLGVANADINDADINNQLVDTLWAPAEFEPIDLSLDWDSLDLELNSESLMQPLNSYGATPNDAPPGKHPCLWVPRLRLILPRVSCHEQYQ